MLTICGLRNTFEDKTRYPPVTIEDIRKADCELLLLSSEPYPFKQQLLAELQESLPDTKIMLVDGEIFSWYGSRLLHAANYFREIFLMN